MGADQNALLPHHARSSRPPTVNIAAGIVHQLEEVAQLHRGCHEQGNKLGSRSASVATEPASSIYRWKLRIMLNQGLGASPMSHFCPNAEDCSNKFCVRSASPDFHLKTQASDYPWDHDWHDGAICLTGSGEPPAVLHTNPIPAYGGPRSAHSSVFAVQV